MWRARHTRATSTNVTGLTINDAWLRVARTLVYQTRTRLCDGTGHRQRVLFNASGACLYTSVAASAAVGEFRPAGDDAVALALCELTDIAHTIKARLNAAICGAAITRHCVVVVARLLRRADPVAAHMHDRLERDGNR